MLPGLFIASSKILKIPVHSLTPVKIENKTKTTKTITLIGFEVKIPHLPCSFSIYIKVCSVYYIFYVVTAT